MARPSEIENELRSAGRVAIMALIALALLIAVVLGLSHHGPPGPVPCPPAECTFRPHAPHGPGPGMRMTP